jgi:hypothetical protein
MEKDKRMNVYTSVKSYAILCGIFKEIDPNNLKLMNTNITLIKM